MAIYACRRVQVPGPPLARFVPSSKSLHFSPSFSFLICQGGLMRTPLAESVARGGTQHLDTVGRLSWPDWATGGVAAKVHGDGREAGLGEGPVLRRIPHQPKLGSALSPSRSSCWTGRPSLRRRQRAW